MIKIVKKTRPGEKNIFYGFDENRALTPFGNGSRIEVRRCRFGVDGARMVGDDDGGDDDGDDDDIDDDDADGGVDDDVDHMVCIGSTDRLIHETDIYGDHMYRTDRKIDEDRMNRIVHMFGLHRENSIGTLV